jgi:hypothetical protein
VLHRRPLPLRYIETRVTGTGQRWIKYLGSGKRKSRKAARHGTLRQLISPHLTSPHLISFYRTSPHLILSHLTSLISTYASGLLPSKGSSAQWRIGHRHKCRCWWKKAASTGACMTRVSTTWPMQRYNDATNDGMYIYAGVSWDTYLAGVDFLGSRLAAPSLVTTCSRMHKTTNTTPHHILTHAHTAFHSLQS